ncbi:MAG: hypothetical protein ABIA12_03200 [Candidatus Aenigmatarchaeota archaeon]
MHPVVNIIIGAVLLIASIAYVYTDQYGAWGDFLTVVNGTVPAFVALIGVFVIWLELDELKVRKELRSEKARKK